MPSRFEAEALRHWVRNKWVPECGKTLHRRRKEAGLSLVQLADMSDLTPATISRIENGLLVPNDATRALIAFALGARVEEIWPAIPQQRALEIAGAPGQAA